MIQERGASQLPLTAGLGGADVDRLIRSDPDALIYQFVVEAVRSDAVGGRADMLEPVAVEWPDLDAERAARDEETVALRNEVAAWQRSRLVRMTQPLRRIRTALRGRA